MMRKRIVASILALVMVLGMSLNSFAAFRNPDQTLVTNGEKIYVKTTRKVSIADFVRLRKICNEEYDSSLTQRVKNAEGGLTGTAEPVGSDVTDPEEYDKYGNAKQKKFEDRKWTGRTVDVKTCIYGGISSVTGKPIVERIDTTQQKLYSMHDYVGQSEKWKVRFVNGIRLSDTEFVIRVDNEIQDQDGKGNSPQTFRGDYYVSVLPYKERVTGTHVETDAFGKEITVEDTEAIEVPDEFGDVYNNENMGHAWFFCMLFDETQPVGKQQIIGYLVARRITRWPDWNDQRFYYPGVNNLEKYKDGVRVFVKNPTQLARESEIVYKNYHKDANLWNDKGTQMKTTGAEVNFKQDVPAEKREETGEKLLLPNQEVGTQKVVALNTFFDLALKYPQAQAYPTPSYAEKDSTTKRTVKDWLDMILEKNSNF